MDCNPIDDDHFHDECGVVAVINHPEASHKCYLGLYALQHRGQEGAGIAAIDDSGRMTSHKKRGLVSDVFEKKHFARVPGLCAIGHVRYATFGGSFSENLQPITVNSRFGPIAVAHNGNIPRAHSIRMDLENQGAIFQSTTDTELVVHLVTRSRKDTLKDAIVEALQRLEGAFSLVILTQEGVFAARDPYGFRPLAMGRSQGPVGETKVIASETCAFELMNVVFEREVEAGEMIHFHDGMEESSFPFKKQNYAPCVFESIYFSRPDSIVEGRSIYEARVALGRRLAEEAPAPGADVVIPVPDSGVSAAIGYSQVSGIPYEMGILKNHYVHRTFIQPSHEGRVSNLQIKLNPIRTVLEGKSIVVIDDSIVRGTTMRQLIDVLRLTGVKEIHLRISSAPIIGPCFFGINTPTQSELIAAHHTIEEVREFVGVDSLRYLSLEGMVQSVSPTGSVCHSCFTGRYPMGLTLDTETKRA